MKPFEREEETKLENLQVADRLVEIVNMNTELFHDSSNNCYATFTNKGHRECWELESSGFRDWLSYMFFWKPVALRLKQH